MELLQIISRSYYKFWQVLKNCGVITNYLLRKTFLYFLSLKKGMTTDNVSLSLF